MRFAAISGTNITYDVVPLIVVVGLASAAYRRKDGVYVVPLTALKP